MILVDDLLVRPLMGLLRTLHDMALREAYDVEAIRDEMKENQLLYEIGDRSPAAYRERRDALEAELEVAKEAREQLQGKAEVIR